MMGPCNRKLPNGSRCNQVSQHYGECEWTPIKSVVGTNNNTGGDVTKEAKRKPRTTCLECGGPLPANRIRYCDRCLERAVEDGCDDEGECQCQE